MLSVRCTLHLVYRTIAKTQLQNMPLLPSPWHNKQVGFGGLFGQPMPIATHSPIGHELPYWPMRSDRHGLAGMALKRHRHEQQCKAARRHPLSPVDNIKNYFINNTRHFNVQLNFIIILYYVWLVRYFQGCRRCIGVMVLSVMTQRRAIINDVLRCNLSPSQSCHTIPRPFQPPPPCMLVDCSVVEVV